MLEIQYLNVCDDEVDSDFEAIIAQNNPVFENWFISAPKESKAIVDWKKLF